MPTTLADYDAAMGLCLTDTYDRDHFQIILKEHPLPKRWRPRDNDSVRLLCNASSFIEQLSRLQRPEGSFLKFSQAG